MTDSLNVNFVHVGEGRFAVYHRPRRADFPLLREMGCTHIITLLKLSEGAQQYGNMTRAAGMEWVWISVPNGNYPEGEVHDRLIEVMPKLAQLLDENNSILIHCSAGVHRTGLVAYALLRWRGIESERAMQIIAQTRNETAEGMMEKRKYWGDKYAPRSIAKESTWINSVKEFAHRLRTNIFKKH